MTEQKKTGKTDEQIIKDATAKAGIFMVLMMMIIFIMVFAFVIIATGDVCHEALDCSLVDPFIHFSIYPKEYSMTKLALFVRLEAKPGQEAALADFLASALPLANAESGTTAWFALKFGPSTFGVFDAFADEAGRQAHLNGQIAAALMANAATLLSSPPNIEKVELLAAKLPA